jgi:hypothetical protein
MSSSWEDSVLVGKSGGRQTPSQQSPGYSVRVQPAEFASTQRGAILSKQDYDAESLFAPRQLKSQLAQAWHKM